MRARALAPAFPASFAVDCASISSLQSREQLPAAGPSDADVDARGAAGSSVDVDVDARRRAILLGKWPVDSTDGHLLHLLATHIQRLAAPGKLTTLFSVLSRFSRFIGCMETASYLLHVLLYVI